MRAKIILMITLLIVVSGCAKKAPPVPWESIVPKRIVDLVAVPREGRLLLGWTVPQENTDKSVLTDLAGFQILRSEGVLIGEECKGCGEKKTVVHEVKWDIQEEGKKVSKEGGKEDRKEEGKKKRMAIFFEDQEARKVYVYQVVSTNRRGYPSAPSNPVTVYWDYPPQAPGMVKGERGDKRVELYWEPVEGVTGYNVYRRLEEKEFFTRPLNREPLTTTHFLDLNVENEKKYIYSVRAVRRVVKTDVEGKGSLEVPVTPTDLIAPAAPVGLVAIPLQNGIELNWRGNREPDLLGYHVYRRNPGEKEFKRMNESPLTKTTYLDTEVALQQEYEYVVTAVDNSTRRNESPQSEEVRVKYLY
jgi:fibronectin type 3 domain-containing protein